MKTKTAKTEVVCTKVKPGTRYSLFQLAAKLTMRRKQRCTMSSVLEEAIREKIERER
jgi:hypothetical protein